MSLKPASSRTALVAALVLTWSGASAQTSASKTRVVGQINGQPLLTSDDKTAAVTQFRLAHRREPSTPADQQEVDAAVAKSQCTGVENAIYGAAKQTQMSRLGITVSPQEVQEYKAAYLKIHDPRAEAKKSADDAAALVSALTEVYQNGMDQHQAYEKYLAPRGYSETAWTANLVPGKSAQWRAQYLARFAAPASASDKAISDALDSSLKRQIESDHLNAAVDQQISSLDPTFRTYLEEETRNTVGHPPQKTTRTTPANHADYLQTKRIEWWQARESEVNISMSDPALAKRCGIETPYRPKPIQPRKSGAPPPGTPVPITITPINPPK